MPDAIPTKSGGKLSRSQVQEILERNSRLYKDEDNFIPYIVELAMYLLEYEYDWNNSGGAPPKSVLTRSESASAADKASKSKESIKPEDRVRSRPVMRLKDDTQSKSKACPHCGSQIGDELICPTCRNVAR